MSSRSFQPRRGRHRRRTHQLGAACAPPLSANQAGRCSSSPLLAVAIFGAVTLGIYDHGLDHSLRSASVSPELKQALQAARGQFTVALAASGSIGREDFERLLAHRQIINDNEVKTMRIHTRRRPARRLSDFQQHAALDCSAGREPPDAAASANNVNQRCIAIKCVSTVSLPRGIGCLG